MQRISRRAIYVAGALFAIGLAGCPGPQDNTTPNPGPVTPTSNGAGQTSSPTGFKAALVFDLGGKDDKSFNASANAGLERAQKELNLGPDGIKTVESHTPADYKTNLTNFASQNYDIVLAVGFNMASAIKDVAPQFPKTKFAIIDADAPEGAPNVAGLRFQEEQGSFLAGYLAASMSKTRKIGFVGGMKIPLIEKFEAGYRAGAKTAGYDPDKQVVATYVGDWNDLAAAKSQASQQYASGVDIIYQAAGKAGENVIEEAKEKGKGYYAIGVDRDQDYIAPGSVLTSMVKRVDNAVFDTIKQAKDGKFTAGSHVYSMKDGGISLSEMKYTKKDIPADVLAKLDKLSKMVTDGTVVPPTKDADVAGFKPPSL